MIWVSFRNPNTPGLYGVLLNEIDRKSYACFSFGYWDGKGWKIPSESDLQVAPYRPVKTWCKLEIGTDWNGID